MSMLGTVVRNHPGTARYLKSGTGFRKATTQFFDSPSRIDFYEVCGRVYFGETTFSPADGLMPFEPPHHDLEYGRKLRLSKKKSFRDIIL